jgi:hypothetical protein
MRQHWGLIEAALPHQRIRFARKANDQDVSMLCGNASGAFLAVHATFCAIFQQVMHVLKVMLRGFLCQGESHSAGFRINGIPVHYARYVELL